MTRVLIWKELREQAAVVIALTVLGCGVLVSMAVLLDPTDSGSINDLKSLTMAGRLGVILLTMTAGLVIGGTLFAGERENGSFLYLDRLPGSRWRIWWRKVVAGVVMASLATVSFVGVSGALGLIGSRDEFAAWVVIAFLLSAVTFGWGAVGSVNARTSLEACGVGIVYAIGFLIVTVVLVQIGLFLVSVVYPDVWGMYRGMLSGLTGLVPTFAAIVCPLPISAWLFSAPDRDRRFGTALSIPIPGGGFQAPRIQISLGFLAPRGWFTTTRRLWWLFLRQYRVTLIVLSVVALISGGTLLIDGATLIVAWPIISLFLGVLVGVTNLSDEQSTEASQFWGERRLPVGRIWRGKVLSGLAMTFGLSVVMMLPVLFKLLVSGLKDAQVLTALNTRIIGEAGFPLFSYAFIWPVYGFVFTHLAAMLFRKAIVAGAVGLMLGGLFAVVWLPSLFGGGIHGWQIWLPVVFALLTARWLAWSWVTNRIGSRRALWRLAVGGTAVVGAFGFGIAYRVLEVPEIPEVEDDIRFAETLPSFDEKQAGRDLRRAASLFKEGEPKQFDTPLDPPLYVDPNWLEHEKKFRGTGLEQIATVIQHGYPADRPDVDALIESAFRTEWEELLRESAKKPTGVMDDPTEMAFDYQFTNLELLRKMMIVYLAGGLQRQARGQPEVFVERLELWLSVVRNVKNRSTIQAVDSATGFEVFLFEAFDRWLEKLDARPDLLRRALKAIRYHDEQEPYNPHWTLLAQQTVARRAINTPSQWMPNYLDGIHFHNISGLSSEAQAESDVVAFMWTVPWEQERLRRVIGLGNVPTWSLEQRQYLRGIPGAVFLGIRSNELLRSRKEFDVMVQTHHRAAMLKLALRLHHANNGQFPKKLEELVPKYLDKLPIDPHQPDKTKSFGYRVCVNGEAIPTNDQNVRYTPDPDILNCHSENEINLANGVAAISGSVVLWGRWPDWVNPLNTRSDDGIKLAHGVSALCGSAVLWNTPNLYFDPPFAEEPPPVSVIMSGMAGPSAIGSLQMIPVLNQIVVQPGHAIIWSVGPDRRDDAATTALETRNSYPGGVGDIVFIVPLPVKAGAKKP